MALYSDGIKAPLSGSTDGSKLTNRPEVSLKENSVKFEDSASDADSRSSFECLYIDETGDGRDKGAKSTARWDTDSSIVSSESRHSKNHHRDDRSKKQRRHKDKHKKKDAAHNSTKKHKHRRDELKRTLDKKYHKQFNTKDKSRNASLNDALAGALDGMEDLIRSSNYAERVALSE